MAVHFSVAARSGWHLTRLETSSYPLLLLYSNDRHAFSSEYKYKCELEDLRYQLVHYTQHNEGNLQAHGSTDTRMDHSSMSC